MADDGSVTQFCEKPQLDDNWVNAGFFVFNRKVFDYLDGDETASSSANRWNGWPPRSS